MKNEYAKKLQMRRQMASEITQLWTAQLCMDVMTLVLNDPEIMGKDTFGKERLTKLSKGFNAKYRECIVGLTKDVKASYIREKIDERLRRINGSEFEPWEERYEYWDDKGI